MNIFKKYDKQLKIIQYEIFICTRGSLQNSLDNPSNTISIPFACIRITESITKSPNGQIGHPYK